jgi:hypothetical protein
VSKNSARNQTAAVAAASATGVAGDSDPTADATESTTAGDPETTEGDNPAPEDEPEQVIGLDRSRPYATVHGGGTGAAFSQDGKFYNNDGQEVDAP